MSRRRIVIGPAALILGGLLAGPVVASCIEPPPLAQGLAEAQVVFVGSVTEVRHNASTAAVAVEEVWKGPDLPTTVVVTGGQGQEGVASSVDRSYEVGRRYLFVPELVDGALRDNACSHTQLYAPAVEALRPADARPPADAPDPDPAPASAGMPSVALVGGLVLAAGLAVLGAAVLVRRRRAA